jgi:hypothetical protein
MRAVLSIADFERVRVTLTETGSVKVAGPRDAVARVISSLRPIVEAIRSARCPADEPVNRFESARQGAIRFAAVYAAEAMRLGWARDELFALTEPFANLSRQGAAWFVGGAAIVEVTAAAITLRTASGATTRIYKKTLH